MMPKLNWRAPSVSIQDASDRLGGEVMPKLNWRAPSVSVVGVCLLRSHLCGDEENVGHLIYLNIQVHSPPL